jgi:hypothetical protein
MGCPAASRRRRNFHVGVQKSLRGGSSCSSVTTKVPGLVGVSTGAATCSRSCEALFFLGAAHCAPEHGAAMALAVPVPGWWWN